jgi:hypothetical protein
VNTGYIFLRDRIERELKNMGLITARKIYAVYYGGSGRVTCGGGAYPSNLPGRVAAMYVNSLLPDANGNFERRCDERVWGDDRTRSKYMDYGMLHEILHTQGFVALGAPNQHAAGHVSTQPIPVERAT